MKNTALITGASSGIGAELAKIHAEKTGDLVIVARRKEKLDKLKQEIESKYNRDVLVVDMDLTEESAARDLYKILDDKGITIDYLINNAGFGGRGKFHERTWESDLSMIQLNVVALTDITRKFLPAMVKRDSGRVLNVSSTASLMPGPLQAVYFATKAYVTSFSNAIAEELHDTKVTVTALMPGATDTEFAQRADMENTDLFDQAFSAHDVALTGYKAMMDGKLDVLAGVSWGQKMMMKSVAIMPKQAILTRVRKMQEQK